MLVTSLLLSAIGLVSAFPTPSTVSSRGDTGALVSDVTIFQPPANYTIPRTLYARTLQLGDGTFLATWENYGPNNDTFPYFPIYQSTDGGFTWCERSRVEDTQNGWGLRYQPFLYVLQETIGDYPAGTLLLSGNSIPDDLSQTLIEIYASRDQGYTWTFVCHVARGGKAVPNNGETPVWEPFLMEYDGQLIVYYSDQRDPSYGQKLAHQTTTDLVTFGDVVNDVTSGEYSQRPGMTTVSHLPDDNYLLTYEFGGAPTGDFDVYYRLSKNPLAFDQATAYPIVATDGSTPVSSPYNVWTPAGGDNGTIVVSCYATSEVYINRDLAAPNSPWEKVSTPEGASYSRSLLVERDQNRILIAGGGALGGENNSVTASEIDVSKIS